MPELSREEVLQLVDTSRKIRALISAKHPQAEKPLTDAFNKLLTETFTQFTQKTGLDEVQVKQETIKTLQFLWKDNNEKACAYIKLFDKEIPEVVMTIFNKMSSLIQDSFQINELIILQNQTLQEQLDVCKKEIEEVLQAAEEIEQKAVDIQFSKDELQQKYDTLSEKYESQLEQLQQENKQYFDKIVKLSKQQADYSVSYAISPRRIPQKPPARNIRTASPSRSANGSIFGSGQSKELSLKQLKEFIVDLYRQKEKFDIRQNDSKQPTETLQQYVFTYLNTRYGLKSIINEWSNAILNGIKKFENNDIEVRVFAKILRNDLDENAKEIVEQVKKTVLQVLRRYVNTKYPYMIEPEYKQLVQNKINGSLDQEEWREIVYFMYNQQDAEVITQKLEEISWNHNGRAQRFDIKYIDLITVMIEFQINTHEKFIEPVRDAFRNIDNDNDGIISEYQLKELFSQLEIESYQQLTSQMDPNETGVITFSKIIITLASDLIEYNGITIPLLHKIYYSKDFPITS